MPVVRAREPTRPRTARPSGSYIGLPADGAPGHPVKSSASASTTVRVPRLLHGPKLTGAAAHHAHSLLDPINGPTVCSNYPGAKGYITRFTSEYLLGDGTTTTAGFCTFVPSAINGSSATPAGSPAALSLGYGPSVTNVGSTSPGYHLTANIPGSGFLYGGTGVASCHRVVAACMTVIPVGASLYRAALIRKHSSGASVMPAHAFTPAGTATFVTDLTNFMPGYPITESLGTEGGSHILRWYPANTEHDYGLGGNFTGPGELNGVSFAWSAGSVQTQFVVRVTAIVEWLPNTSTSGEGSGLVAPAGQNSVIPMTHVQSALSAAHPNWMFATIKEAVGLAKEVAPYVAMAAEYAPTIAAMF